MVSNEKIINNTIVYLIKIYKCYFGHFLIRESDINIVHIFYIFSYSFMKPYEKDVDFVNNVIITFTNEDMTKIKVVDLKEIYNFYIHNLRILTWFPYEVARFESYVLRSFCYFLSFC
jgi:hypothetical protein